MTKHIFITRELPAKARVMLEEKDYIVDVNPKDRMMSQKDIIKALKKKPYDAVITLLTDKIDAKVFDAAPTVKLFSNYAMGYDNLDLTEATKRGIQIANAPSDMSSEAVAEHALALLIALATRIVEANEFVKRGKYDGWAPMRFIGTDFKDKTLGLIGTGHIGERVAHYAHALGMKIVYFDVVPCKRMEEEHAATLCASVEDLLKISDFVSVHVPLLPSTKHLINAERLKMMKPTSFLINTSRGPIVDEEALVYALQKGIIRGAGLDVYEFEPKMARGLTKLSNVILTPHIASASEAARDEMAEAVAHNVIDFFEKGTALHLVNK